MDFTCLGGNRLNRQTFYMPQVDGVVGLPQFYKMFLSYSLLTEFPFKINGQPQRVDGAFENFGAIKELPEIDYSKTMHWYGFVKYTYGLEKIDLTTAQINSSGWPGAFMDSFVKKIISMPLDESLTTPSAYTDTFTNCMGLTDISFRGKFGASVDFHYCPFSNGAVLCNIAWALSETNVGTVTFKSGTIGTIMSNAHVKLNEAGDGLETCNAGDEGDLGTMASYITGKGWTIAYQ